MKHKKIRNLIQQILKEEFLNKNLMDKEIKLEGSEIAVKDLRYEVQEHVNNASEALQYAASEIYQLYKVAEEIKIEWPDISEKILQDIEPMLKNIENYPNKLKFLVGHIKQVGF